MSPTRTAALLNTLRQFRVDAGLTQQVLAEKVGVTRKTINTVENSVFIPSTVLALKLANGGKRINQRRLHWQSGRAQ